MKKVNFHGYTILEDSTVLGKNGKPLKWHLRERRGGGVDKRVTLYIGGKRRHFTLSRLVVSCFQGPVYGYEINHKNRDPMDCRNDNMERATPSENQRHWRDCELSL